MHRFGMKFLLLLFIFSQEVFGKTCLNNLTISVSSLPDKIPDPIFSKSIIDAFFYRQVLENLVSISDTGQLVAAIADEWKISADGLVYDFFLNPKSRFANGSAITATDIAYSLSRPLWQKPDQHNRGVLRSFLEGAAKVKDKELPTGIEPVSSSHLRLRLRKPYPPFLKILAYSLYGVTKLDETRDKVVSTSGAMMIAESTESSIILKKNPHYALGLHCIPQVANFVRNKNISEVSAGIRSKKIDLAFGYSGMQIDKTENAVPTSIAYNHLFLNKNKSEFKVDEFRKDLVDQLKSAFWQHLKPSEHAKKWDYLMPPTVMGQEYYLRKITRDLNPEKFKRKWCPKYCQRPLKILLVNNERNNLDQDGLKKTLTSIGMNNIQVYFPTAKEWFSSLRSGDFDLIEASYLGTYSDPDSYLNPMIGDNAVGTLLSGDLGKEIESIRFTRSESERKQKYAQVIQNFEDLRYFVPLQYIPTMMYKGDHVLLPSSQFKYDLRLDAQQNF